MPSAHPFFCHQKNCRKTAARTPEYLSGTDWRLLRALIAVLEAGDMCGFDALLRRAGAARAFFHRICGWPEGLTYYMRGSDAYRLMWFTRFAQVDLEQWKQAVLDHQPKKRKRDAFLLNQKKHARL